MTNIVQMRGKAKLAWIIPSAADIIKNVKTQKINIWRWELIEPTLFDKGLGNLDFLSLIAYEILPSNRRRHQGDAR